MAKSDFDKSEARPAVDGAPHPGWWKLLLPIAVVAAGLACYAVLQRASGRSELRRYKSELENGGERFKLEGFRASSGKGEDGAELLKALSAFRMVGGVNPGSLEPMKLVGPGQARLACLEAESLETGKGSGIPWRELSRLLETNKVALADLRSALKHPVPFDIGRTNFRQASTLRPQDLRNGAQYLWASAVANLHSRNREGALEDLEALLALARVHEQEPVLLVQAIRAAICGLAVSLTWEFLNTEGLGEEECRRLQRAWTPLDVLRGIELGVEGDRAFAGEIWSLTRSGDGGRLSAYLNVGQPPLETMLTDYVKVPLYRATRIDKDELHYLQSVQNYLEGLRALRAGTRWALVNERPGFGPHDASFGEDLAYWLSSKTSSSFYKFIQMGARRETERRMAMVAVAIHAHLASRGRLPETLEVLVPGEVELLLGDPMAGAPFRYRAGTNSSYQLYSVGFDGVDNQGDSRCGTGITNAYSLWNSPDAVWPQPVRTSIKPGD